MPLYRFELQVAASPSEVATRLHAITQPKRTAWKSMTRGLIPFGGDGPPFLGEVSDDSFRLRRDIGYRNSFLPRINGRFTPTLGGTFVSVRMTVHPFVVVFMVVWFSFLLVICGAALSSHPHSLRALSIPSGMLVFAVVLTCGCFFPEALWAKHLIRQAVTTNTES